MSLEFLSGIGARRKAPARKAARQEKRAEKKAVRVEKRAEKKAVKVEKQALKKGKVNARQMKALQKKAPATAARLKKSIVTQIQRNKMVEQGEPLVSPEMPSADEQVENEIVEQAAEDQNEGIEEVNETEFNQEGTPDSESGGEEMGLIYPDYYALSGRKKNKPAKQARKAKRKAKIQKFKAKVKTVANKAKKVGFAVPRKALLTLIGLGKKTEKLLKFNLTKKLATIWNSDNGKGLKALWIKFGGNPEELKKAINKGSTVQVNGASLGVEPTTTTAVLTAAAPILVGITKLFLDYKKKRADKGLPEETPEEETSETIPDETTEETEQISGLTKMRINKYRQQQLRNYINQ